MTDPATTSDRRAFLLRVLRLGGASAATLGLGTYLAGRSLRPAEGAAADVDIDHRVAERPDLPELAVAQGEAAGPAALVERALADLGGMARFVARGDTVVVKPNIAWDRLPEHAATTNPEVVAALVRLCLAAGAGSVIVTDVSCNEAEACFDRSGIAAAARAAGAEVVLPQTALLQARQSQGRHPGRVAGARAVPRRDQAHQRAHREAPQPDGRDARHEELVRPDRRRPEPAPPAHPREHRRPDVVREADADGDGRLPGARCATARPAGTSTTSR